MEAELKETLREACQAAEGLGIKAVLVGALMAEFTPEIGPGGPRFRRTNDADFGVYVRDWDGFRRLRAELARRGFQPNPKIEHRLHRGTSNTGCGTTPPARRTPAASASRGSPG